MLYIFTPGNETPKEWHVGDHTKDHPWFKAIKPEYVREIQADGDELYAIWDICKGTIPLAFRRNSNGGHVNLKRVQNWYGDHAKFIFQNVVMGYEYT